ncbi:MAG TPA: beta-N-acetylhexosaminidase [Burkholderiaceae bacterium]
MAATTAGPVVIDIAGTRLGDTDRARLSHPLVGMVILFSRNFDSPAQLLELTGEIHALRDPPLLVAVDHEGGRVQRFRRGFTAIPPMAALGQMWERDVLVACRVACAAGYLMGAELRAHGVDLTFAPVLDLNWGRSAVIGDRALHTDPRVVALLGGQLGHGLALAGMSNCGKHFPGHGWALADSHHEVPVDERPLEEILRDDAAPYGWLGIAAAGVMPAHVVYPLVDAMPAGFSARWIGDILRGRLGFAGAVFSDDLSMRGAQAAGGIVERAQTALEAGCDFVLVCNDAGGAERVLAGLRWDPAPAFEQRRSRLVPRGAAPAMAQLQASEVYQAALRDLREGLEALEP